MVKRGGKEIVTVDIEKEIYENLKKKAELGRHTVKEYINNLLRTDIERSKILLKAMPRLSMGGYKKNAMIFVNDKSSEGGSADVYVIDGKLHCDECGLYDCEHVQFASLQPEAIDLLSYDKKHN